MQLGLAGKVAMITGGSKGIGLQTALQLSQEGVRVAICARDAAGLEKAKRYLFNETGQEVFTVVADMTNKADCARFVAETVTHFGQLDILINNAGTTAAKAFNDVSEELWEQDVALKVFAAIYTMRMALPHMKTRGGAIVNVTAIAGKTPGANSLPTSMSRAAGQALVNAASKDLGKYNIRVNTVCIGLIRSAQIEQIWKQSHPSLTWDEFSAKMGEDIPLGRIGKTEEAANVITFLVSDAASYVSGTAVNIDGGKAPSL